MFHLWSSYFRLLDLSRLYLYDFVRARVLHRCSFLYLLSPFSNEDVYFVIDSVDFALYIPDFSLNHSVVSDRIALSLLPF